MFHNKTFKKWLQGSEVQSTGPSGVQFPATSGDSATYHAIWCPLLVRGCTCRQKSDYKERRKPPEK